MQYRPASGVVERQLLKLRRDALTPGDGCFQGGPVGQPGNGDYS
jgi:hypothetical protein